MKLPVALALLLVSAAPVALAADAARVEGEVVFHEAPRLEGRVRVSAQDGALDLAPAAGRGEALRLSWDRAEGRMATSGWTVVTPVGPVRDRSDVAPLRFDAAELRVLACEACDVLLVASGDGALAYAGLADGALAWRRGEERYCAEFCDNSEPGRFAHASRAGDLLFSGRADGALVLRGGVPSAEGRVGLFVRNATVEVLDASGNRTVLDTRTQEAPLAGAGQASASRRTAAFLYVDLDGARLEAPSGSAALLMAAEPLVEVSGRLAAASASGALEYDGEARGFARERLEVDGDLALRPVAQGGLLRAAGVGPAEARGALEGEASRVRIGAATYSPAASVGVVAGGAAAAVSAVATALLARAALVALYSRIRPDRVLANPNRRRLHEILRASPGRTVGELREATGLARIVVQHHLRLLAAHRLVQSAWMGRARRWSATDAPADPAAVEADLALRDASRRRVAEALAEADGLTQRDLVVRTGLSQRLVSYHLARLRGASLVETDDASPRRYRPTGLLAGLLRARRAP